jgi:hypothetical protein
MQLVYTGEAEWCPEASSRGDAKQPKRRAGRRRVRTQGGGGGGANTGFLVRGNNGDWASYCTTGYSHSHSAALRLPGPRFMSVNHQSYPPLVAIAHNKPGDKWLLLNALRSCAPYTRDALARLAPLLGYATHQIPKKQ